MATRQTDCSVHSLSKEDLKEQKKVELVVGSGDSENVDLEEDDDDDDELANSSNDTFYENSNETLLLGDDIEKSDELQPSSSSTTTSANAINAEELESLIGKTIAGKLQIISKLGEGGMSVVYKAKHLLLDRMVAVKVVHPGRMQNKLIMRFQQEAKAATALNHVNIATVREFGIDEGRAFLVMDFVDGDSLSDIIKEQGKLNTEQTKKIISQICAGLQHAHDAKVVHRDLKPSNIILSKDANGTIVPKIVDFGIAKLVDEETESDLTQTGEVFGTPNYMSPEQCLGKRADKRSDIYSVGCMMYECLMGRTPFTADSSLEILMKHVNEEFQVPKPSPSHDLMNAIKGCLEKKPDDRWQSADDLRQFIEEPNGPANKKYRNLKRGFSSRQIALIAAAAVITGAASAAFMTIAPLSGTIMNIVQPKPWVAMARQASANAAMGPANYISSLAMMNKALKEAEKANASDIEMESILVEKGHLLSNMNKPSDSIKSLSAALSLNEKHGEDFNRGSIHDWIAQDYLNQQDYKNALKHAKDAVAIKTRTIGERDRLTLLSIFRQGQAEKALNDLTSAEKTDKKILDLVNGLYPQEDNLLVSDAHHQLANVLVNQRYSAKAIEHYKKSLSIVSELLGKDNERTIHERDHLIKYAMETDHPEVAQQIRDQYK